MPKVRKQLTSKPTPVRSTILGTGGARKAAEALKKRQKKLGNI